MNDLPDPDMITKSTKLIEFEVICNNEIIDFSDYLNILSLCSLYQTDYSVRQFPYKTITIIRP